MSDGQLTGIIIVAIVMIASMVTRIVKVRYQYANKSPSGENEQLRAGAAEAERLREEVRQLKERLHVLERIAVEKESSLEREFARLRNE